jgi:hypothetical protein
MAQRLISLYLNDPPADPRRDGPECVSLQEVDAEALVDLAQNPEESCRVSAVLAWVASELEVPEKGFARLIEFDREVRIPERI